MVGINFEQASSYLYVARNENKLASKIIYGSKDILQVSYKEKYNVSTKF